MKIGDLVRFISDTINVFGIVMEIINEDEEFNILENKFEKKNLINSGLLSTKPKLYVCNVDEQSIEKGNNYMAHKCGFTYSVLDNFFSDAGFQIRYGGRRREQWDLFMVAFKQKKSEEEAKKIANPFF